MMYQGGGNGRKSNKYSFVGQGYGFFFVHFKLEYEESQITLLNTSRKHTERDEGELE